MHARLPAAVRRDVAAATAVTAWRFAEVENTEAAHLAYQMADAVYPEACLCPDLAVRRHTLGPSGGLVVSPPMNEDRVTTIGLPHRSAPTEIESGMAYTEIGDWAAPLWAFREWFDPGFHSTNISHELPHVMVLSTGRCGTVSLWHLLSGSNVVPYHNYWWHAHLPSRLEAMCRFVSGRYDGSESLWHEWMTTRAAEWLGCVSQRKPMVALNHWDTIWAPVFAALHPRSRFVHLRRDPVALFESFYGKAQWGTDQLRPLFYAFDPYRWCETTQSEAACLAWYFQFTEAFARSVARVVAPGRFIEIEAEKLFAQDREELGRLLDFIDADISLDRAMAHFETPVNAKAHKARPIPEAARLAFEQAMFGATI